MLQYGLSKLIIVVVWVLSFTLTPIVNNLQSGFTVERHIENKHNIIFYCKTKVNQDNVVVDINKDTGKTKLIFKDKRKGIEFDLEWGKNISPEDREQVDKIFNNVYEYTKKDKTISGKVRRWIKNFVNRKL